MELGVVCTVGLLQLRTERYDLPRMLDSFSRTRSGTDCTTHCTAIFPKKPRMLDSFSLTRSGTDGSTHCTAIFLKKETSSYVRT